jgi:hypothetical protein
MVVDQHPIPQDAMGEVDGGTIKDEQVNRPPEVSFQGAAKC